MVHKDDSQKAQEKKCWVVVVAYHIVSVISYARWQ